MNSTGPISTWNINPLNVGPIYPFAGWELPMFVACLAFCIAFMAWKLFTENAMFAKESQELRKGDTSTNALFAKSSDNENTA